MTESRQPEADLLLLIRRARKGDPEAFDRLAGSCRERIYRWALVRMGEADDAEDATQEALVRLHRGLHRFDGKARFDTWLYAVTVNAVADILRRKARSLRLRERYSFFADRATAADPVAVEERLESRRLAGLVRTFLVALPARQREALDLVDLQGVGPADAAARLGISHATLRTHLFRARRALRSRLLRDAPGEWRTEGR